MWLRWFLVSSQQGETGKYNTRMETQLPGVQPLNVAELPRPHLRNDLTKYVNVQLARYQLTESVCLLSVCKAELLLCKSQL